MKSLFTLPLLLLCTFTSRAENYPITPVPFTQVKIAPATFWGQRLQASRDVTVPLAFSKCEETGRYRNFEIAAEQLAGKDTHEVKVGGYSFDDTDVYKTVEGCSYLLQTFPNLKLKISVPDTKSGKGWERTVAARHYMDSVLRIVKAAQEPDGYLYTSRTMNPAHPHAWAGAHRWEKVEDLSHEFYNLGHMVEGAIAHYQATGEKTFLDIARAYADCVIREIGSGEGQVERVPGHQIAEMALAKLSVVTGEKKYLDMAKYFLDKRGYTSRRDEYSQAHLPVVEQKEAVGHAVRAAYMYSGMADVAALTGDTSYIRAIDRIWDNIVSRKMYITGGIGSTSSGEAFGRNFQLPNMSAYCETCAAIGNVYVNHRLFLLHGEAKYYDVLERALYNGVISGVSLDGGAFFYPNPLESMGQHQRQAWFGCACCPSNICRFIPSIPGYVYQSRERTLYVNLFMGNTAEVTVGGKKFTLKQETQYPWDGDVVLTVEKGSGAFAMNIRIPGWVQGKPVPSELYEYADGKTLSWSISVNGETLPSNVNGAGYAFVDRRWKKGDTVRLHLDMAPRLVKADERVEADRGRVSVERGPLVYCAEWPDNDFDLGGILLNQKPQFSVDPAFPLVTKQEQIYALTALKTDAQLLNFDEAGRLTTRDVTLRLIPYYAWNHRGAGRMMVWLPQQLRATTPAMPPSLASRSRLSVSLETPATGAVNDRLLPKNADDKSVPYYHWWPREGTVEWLEYALPERTKVSSASVYWYDDQPWGGCAVPASWRILYRTGDGAWTPVDAAPESYGVRRGALNTVRFTPVEADAVRLEVTLREGKSAGLFEWEVE